MNRRFSPSLLLIILLFPLLGTKQIDTPNNPIQQIAQQEQQQQTINFLESPISNEQRERLIKEITLYFEKAIVEQKIVGAGVGIVKCDSIIYAGGFGKKDVALANNEVNEETIFRIGSLSKGFAGVLSGMFVEEGLLDWEDKVIDYVPNFQLRNRQWTKEVTLSHVLSHTSGLPYHSFTNLVEEGLDLETIAGRFKRIRGNDKPGDVHKYQNAIFALSGTMIEKVAEKSYGEVIAERIFEPLNMYTASTDYQSLEESSNVAMPHKKYGNRWRSKDINKKYFNAIPAGGVNASATDMAKWMQFLLGHNPNMMTNEGLQSVFQPIVDLPGTHQYYKKWDGHQESNYAYGWRIHDFVDKVTGIPNKVIHHGGYVNNYRSEIAIFPQEDLGITVLFNSPTKLAKTVVPDLHNIIKEVMEMPEEELLVEYVVSEQAI